MLNAYLPVERQCSVRETLLRTDLRRAIWRALALGCHTREEIARVIGYANRTVGNAIPPMLDDLLRLDPGLRAGQRPINELISYATRNWEFFLDESVRAVNG